MKSGQTILFLTVVLLFSIIPLSCSAAHYSNRNANIQFDLDSTWSVAGTDPLTFVSPKGDTVMTFDAVKADSLEDALDKAETVLAHILTDIFLGEPKYLQINGINSAAVEGKCTMRKMAMVYKLLVLSGSRSDYGIIYYFGTPGHETLNGEALKSFLQSIRKVR